MTLLGILVPSQAMESTWFQVLAAFVAANTLVYAALALGKLFPRKRR